MNIRKLSLVCITIFMVTTQSILIARLTSLPTLPERKNTIRILTLNTALLVVGFGKVEINLKNNKQRAQLIARTIKAMSPQPDIVVFQEAFDASVLRDVLYPIIKDLYPYTFFDMRTNAYVGGGVDSGLAMLSKYPIVRKLQKDYTCWAGIEALALKGIMGAEIFINGCPFYMFTTHTQAGVSKDWYVEWAGKAKDIVGSALETITGSSVVPERSCEGEDPNSLTSTQIVKHELHQAKKVIDSFVENKTAPIIFAGDFNTSRIRDAENYQEFLKTFPGALDTFEKGSKKIKSSSWGDDGKVAATQTDRVDYVWLLNPSKTITGKSDIIDIFTYKMTDHLGILATIEFSCIPVDINKVVKEGLAQGIEINEGLKKALEQQETSVNKALQEALSKKK